VEIVQFVFGGLRVSSNTTDRYIVHFMGLLHMHALACTFCLILGEAILNNLHHLRSYQTNLRDEHVHHHYFLPSHTVGSYLR